MNENIRESFPSNPRVAFSNDSNSEIKKFLEREREKERRGYRHDRRERQQSDGQKRQHRLQKVARAREKGAALDNREDRGNGQRYRPFPNIASSATPPRTILERGKAAAHPERQTPVDPRDPRLDPGAIGVELRPRSSSPQGEQRSDQI